jgi:hypothetical protein
MVPELQSATQKETYDWLKKTLRVSDSHKAGEGKPTVAVADLNTPRNLS